MIIERTPTEQAKNLINYMVDRMFCGDWHAVSDAANDLRVLYAEHPYLEEMEIKL